MAPMSTSEPAGGAFGSRLKQAREARGVSLRQIADRTKLSMVALEALERSDISRLPGGIFTRAFVRSYAAEIGLDPEQTVREFIEQFPHDWVTAGSPHLRQDGEDGQPQHDSRRRALALGIGVAILIAAVAGLLLIWDSSPQDAGVAAEPSAEPLSGAPPSGAEPQVMQTTGEAMVFEVEATASVMLDVVVDGARRESRSVEAGERLVFTAEREMTLTASDAGALRLSINNQPAVALGAAGEARSVRIDRGNVGAFLASQ